ncbi:MAG TPA: DUF5666 domain-containing protein, partial [Woeseiaceae bacterium]|nr:DUF5666 domain-containing protein [Woeseiaceae bacterium]
MNILRSVIPFLAAAGMLTLAACGGGGYGGNSGGGNNPPPPPPTGGITRTGAAVAIGPVTGFGSIIVNGVHYDTGNTTFSDDGTPIQESEIKVGDVVLVQGTIDDDNSNAAAESVSVEDTVEGPVTSIDAVTGSFVVLGQTVQISATTSADDNCNLTGSLDDLLTFAAVEVSGPYDANNAVQATRYECKTAQDIANDPEPFEINGVVSGLDASTGVFMINGLAVDFGTLPAVLDNDFPGGAISDGDPVQAKGATFDDSSQPPLLTASRIDYKGDDFAGNAGDHIEIEGFITRFVDAT